MLMIKFFIYRGWEKFAESAYDRLANEDVSSRNANTYHQNSHIEGLSDEEVTGYLIEDIDDEWETGDGHGHWISTDQMDSDASGFGVMSNERFLQVEVEDGNTNDEESEDVSSEEDDGMKVVTVADNVDPMDISK
jgi:hypothetical protein